ncbi:hypothetical protein PC113_g7196 [Phytophthora cactorum]|uniref:Uncharacterized protein n=1 Tax=Phytophthora cactorum TaxID=29920 RepID=A0A8T0ZGJ3_9STRA|nr:hypothetical protein PC111_g7879 [Phytophthora cactorum]KAG2861429.1 hypothetical protein PC113_g7196 [Phytophthora cactorum]KAG2929320.1 hypothetical protein PC115_g6897 [Phytophthora cactorum]
MNIPSEVAVANATNAANYVLTGQSGKCLRLSSSGNCSSSCSQIVDGDNAISLRANSSTAVCMSATMSTGSLAGIRSTRQVCGTKLPHSIVSASNSTLPLHCLPL